MNDIEKAIEDLRGLCDRSVIESEIFKKRHEKNFDLAISALEKQIELNDYLNTLRKNKKYQIYDILSEFALEEKGE